ncbi:tryptophan halogenase family protein [Cellvibrio fontiphilus]|uniref:Tryptophan halogenase family protein n=1 Tax=Cellvibrio fontiphilus TaxID=1815559 RepID=A0ABV7FK83_9GAMM
MNKSTIKKIVILGGGTAGWMTAAALSRFVKTEATEIILVESAAIGTVGVGEATIPHIRVFNDMLGIDEDEFMRSTRATYKLGIRFDGWGSESSDYFHPFGDHGFPIKGIPFHHYWLRARKLAEVETFDRYSLANVMAASERFIYPSANQNSVESTFSYAYHLDAGAYARFLRDYSEARGVQRVEGEVVSVTLNQDTGFIQSLNLADGKILAGDFFIDCSGFRARLLGQELKVPFTSWNRWLPCDRAFAMPSELTADIRPYTRSSAKSAGWCWQIPLQHRMGNGHVFCSSFCTDQQAVDILLAHVQGKPLADPRRIDFEAGMRYHAWEKNCVAIGLASGFLEPLESTSIYLIQVGIYKLLELLPISSDFELDAKEFNRMVSDEYEKIRDFIILHYHLNNRAEGFWQQTATMNIPDSLQHKMEVFKESASVVEYDAGLFMPPSWLAVYFGQGLFPEKIDSRIEQISTHELLPLVQKIPEHLRHLVKKMPSHTAALHALSSGKMAANSVKPRMSLYGGAR